MKSDNTQQQTAIVTGALSGIGLGLTHGSKETAVQVADAALKHFGRIDLLVNNAGIFISKPFIDYTEEDFEIMVSTNMASFFYMTQQVIPAMRKQKSGMQAVTKELAIELAGDGIRVNTLAPGVVNTPMHANDDHALLKKRHPIRRLAEIPELVDGVQSLPIGAPVVVETIFEIE
jgi:NAD(P)-dependent dehydrogenase (short-subunit alcohol dehydrogenase family)